MSQSASSAVPLDGVSSPPAAAQHQDVLQIAPTAQQTGQTLPAVQPVPSRSRGSSIVHELTQDMDDDPTNPSTSSVRMSQNLDPDGVNVNPWVYDFVNCCITKQCVEAIKKPLPRTKANSAALGLLLSSIPKALTYQVARMNAYDALMWITSKYQGGTNKAINNEWFRRLSEECMTREETLEEYVMRKHTLYQSLLDNHHPLSPDDLSKFIVDGLPAEFGPGRASLYAPCAGDDPNNILRFLRLHAHGIRFNDMTPRPAPKAAKTTVPERNRTDSNPEGKGRGRPRCWQCGAFGHIARDCTKWKDNPPAEPRKPQLQQHSNPLLSMPVVTHNIMHGSSGHEQGDEWIVDSGASVHLTNDMSLLQNVTVLAEPQTLQLATAGAHGAIVATGSICLLNHEGRSAWLHNVKCVPEASSNLLSVSAAVRDGFTFVPKPNGTYCRMEGMGDWTCNVSEKHGLYVLKGVFPTLQPIVCQVCMRTPVLTENSPKQKHDCTLRRLWHERLGHPGKTASERLDREGLCTGIPVSLLPCTQCDTHCDSCVRGKQSKPPFPESSNKPDRILHRIHADTVGELPVSGMGGERYFLTVVDECSGYCEVVPVQHKSSVAQELINVIERWERQCDAKVKVVRTDRGTEFLNKTFHGYCSEKGIHTEMSAAYTPQQNGTAERMNRTVKEKARTLLLGVNADACLWSEAVKSAAHLHNLMPTAGKSKTPFESFTGTKPNLSGLRRWGCLAYVKREKHQTNTLGAQSVPGMFTGYDPHTKGYRVRIGDKVIVSRNVHFVEGKNGALAIGRCTRGGQPQSAVEQVAPAENDNAATGMEEDDISDISLPTSNNPFEPLMDLDNDSNDLTTTTATGSSESDPLVPEPPATTSTSSSTQALPRMIDKTWAAGRDVDDAPNPSSGTRARSRQVFKLLMGYPIRLHNQRGGGKQKKGNGDRLPPPTREERLLQRNARKDALQASKGAELVSESVSEDTQISEAEVGDEIPQSSGEETNSSDKIELVSKGPENGEEGQIASEGTSETGEACINMVQVDELSNDNVARGDSCTGANGVEGGKVGYFDSIRSSSNERVVGTCCNSEDDIIPTASLAFLRACLASPSGVKFCKIQVPSNYREARQSEQWEFWEAAMNEEKNSLDAHECFEYVERERGKKVIPVHWIYSVKVDEHGNVIRYKARLVAQGCRQVLGVDVDEVFAPTSSFGARRVLLAKAAQENLEVHQVDIKTAFLNGDLEEEVYVTQPPGFENGGPQVCRLRKALYGLKQAPRAWYQTLDGVLEKHGFSACMSDAGIYVTKDSTDPMYLVLFVDDMLIMCKNLEKVLAFKKTIAHEFAIHDLGEVMDFLGCHIVRDREKRVMYMSSVGKIDALVEKFGLSGDTRPVETPMSKSFLPTVRTAESGEADGSGMPLEPGHRYCELIGSLLYLANTTRPDIAQAVGVLSRYRGTPTTSHMNEALRLLRYLKGTREYTLRLGGDHIPLEGFVDADYAGDLDTRASTTGFVFKAYGGSVVWGSKKQTGTATSTVEAEFRAASHAVKEAIWLRGLLEELHFDVWKIPLYCDNTGCIQNLKNPVNSKYTKHVAVSFHHARSAVIQGQVDIKYISTQENVADIFTKPLVPVLFRQHCRTLGVIEREQ